MKVLQMNLIPLFNTLINEFTQNVMKSFGIQGHLFVIVNFFFPF
jgi:hypothetical protein